MLQRLLREPRTVQSGDKVCFDDTVECRLLFANEPSVPARIPVGTKILMSAPITIVGGAQRMQDKLSASAEFTGTELRFSNATIAIDKIRGGNWFEVL